MAGSDSYTEVPVDSHLQRAPVTGISETLQQILVIGSPGRDLHSESASESLSMTAGRQHLIELEGMRLRQARLGLFPVAASGCILLISVIRHFKGRTQRGDANIEAFVKGRRTSSVYTQPSTDLLCLAAVTD